MIYIGNLVDFLAYCVVSDTVRDGTFLVSDGEDVSTPNLVRKISSQMNQPSRIFACPPALLLWAGRLLGKEPMMMRMVADLQISIDSTIQRTGWTPPYTLDQGLKDTVAWFNQKS